jgi:hypothetical protein
MKPACKDCRYWETQPPERGWLSVEGLCGRIFEGGMEKGIGAETFNHWGDDSGLRTTPDFYCSEFKEKE